MSNLRRKKGIASVYNYKDICQSKETVKPWSQLSFWSSLKCYSSELLLWISVNEPGSPPLNTEKALGPQVRTAKHSLHYRATQFNAPFLNLSPAAITPLLLSCCWCRIGSSLGILLSLYFMNKDTKSSLLLVIHSLNEDPNNDFLLAAKSFGRASGPRSNSSKHSSICMWTFSQLSMSAVWIAGWLWRRDSQAHRQKCTLSAERHQGCTKKHICLIIYHQPQAYIHMILKLNKNLLEQGMLL